MCVSPERCCGINLSVTPGTQLSPEYRVWIPMRTYLQITWVKKRERVSERERGREGLYRYVAWTSCDALVWFCGLSSDSMLKNFPWFYSYVLNSATSEIIARSFTGKAGATNFKSSGKAGSHRREKAAPWPRHVNRALPYLRPSWQFYEEMQQVFQGVEVLYFYSSKNKNTRDSQL